MIKIIDIKTAIEKLLSDPNITNYKIEKETGIRQTVIGKYTRGESEIGNMSLDNAIKLYNYYLKLKGENKLSNEKRDFAFGKLLSICYVLGTRLFEKGKPVIHENLWNEFPRKPVTVFNHLHDVIMQYTHKFKEKENYLIGLFDEIIGEMDDQDFTDEPLGNQYLLAFYKQNHELKDFVLS